MKKVRRAVIPAAGFGTRFLPFTKASPKEMMPIVDKPVIQYVVEEAVAAGIEEIIFITSSNKRSLEDHFDYNFELEERLKAAGKHHQYEEIRAISDMARFVYLRQKEPRGTGHAVYLARELIGEEPFLVLWGDEFMRATPPRAVQLVAAFEKIKAPVITLAKTKAKEDTYRYGYVKIAKQEGQLYQVAELVEKPGPDKVPSELISISGFVLTPDIFPIIASQATGEGENVLAKAIDKLARQTPVYGLEIPGGEYLDAGSKFGYIRANITLGLEHKETRPELLEFLRGLKL